MKDSQSKPVEGAPTGALRSDPRENAREAEETLDAPHRREQEEANRNKDRARNGNDSGDEEVMRDIGTNLPPD